MARMSIEGAHMIGIFVGTFLFGLYTSLLLAAMIHIKRRRTGSKVVPVMLIIIWILTAISTGCRMKNFCFAFGDAEKSQIFSQPFKRKYYAIVWTLQICCTLLSDSLICWRLFVVWNRSKSILVVPVCLLVGLTVSGSMVSALSFISRTRGVAPSHEFERWVTASSIITLAVNIIVTSLICWKIWCIGRDIPSNTRAPHRRYYATMHALIDSGAIYSISLIVSTALRVAGLKGCYSFMSFVMNQVVGIAPTLIIVRLHLLPLEQPSSTEPETTRP